MNLALFFNNRVFYFSQDTKILEKYEIKYKNQGGLPNEKVLSDGACMAYVFLYLNLFEKFKTLNGFNKYIKEQISNTKKTMPYLYFWMGFQHHIHVNFSSESLYNGTFIPAKKTVHLKKLLDEFQKKKIEFRCNGMDLPNEDMEYISKISIQINEIEGVLPRNIINKYIPILSNLTKNKSITDSSEEHHFVIHQHFLNHHGKEWAYEGSIIKMKSQEEFLNNITHNSLPLQKKYDVICFSTSISFKSGKHAICIMVYPPSSTFKYGVFDPNFGLYEFKYHERFKSFVKYLCIKYYETEHFKAQILGLKFSNKSLHNRLF